jgi:hypothetical protein
MGVVSECRIPGAAATVCDRRERVQQQADAKEAEE